MALRSIALKGVRAQMSGEGDTALLPKMCCIMQIKASSTAWSLATKASFYHVYKSTYTEDPHHTKAQSQLNPHSVDV